MDVDDLAGCGGFACFLGCISGLAGFFLLVTRYGTLFVTLHELLFLAPIGLVVLVMAFSYVTEKLPFSVSSRLDRYLSVPLLCILSLSWISTALAFGLFFTHSLLLMPPEGAITATDFRFHYISIKEGEGISFFNPIDGKAQVLCVGKNGVCQRCDASCPYELVNPGLSIQPGETITVEFINSDDYTITSVTTPQMNMTVHVYVPEDIPVDAPDPPINSGN